MSRFYSEHKKIQTLRRSSNFAKGKGNVVYAMAENIKSLSVVFAFTLMAWASASAEVRLPAIISDHMVLEKSPATHVWGTADPGEAVSVTLDSQTVKTTADTKGKWLASLNLEKSGPGPFSMEVKGTNTISISDVLVGEVWLASGQSNMAMQLSQTIDAKTEIAASTNPFLRHFQVARNTSETPLNTFDGTWVSASPETSGSFSAVAYYFGKSLQNSLQVPIGLIHSSWGGTPVEAWTSPDAIDSVSDLKIARARITENAKTYLERRKAHLDALTAWIKDNQREDHSAAPVERFAAPGISTEDWEEVTFSPAAKDAKLPPAGALWLRRTLDIENAQAGKGLRLSLGVITGYDRVYWNGQLLAETTLDSSPGALSPRRGGKYHVPAKQVKEGANTLAIRIYSPVEPAGFSTAPRAGSIEMPDQWLAKAEYEFPGPPPSEGRTDSLKPFPDALSPHHIPGFLFNAMIHPLLPATLSGVIWYQGESNAYRAWQYRTAFPLLISDWRSQWNQPDLPFYFCQLANFYPKAPEPGDSAWAELRDAQSSALKLPHTGQAVLIDIGEAEDIHPKNKKDVGERLARFALANDYGKDMIASGPIFVSAAVEKNQIRVKFTAIAKGLEAAPIPTTQIIQSATGKTAPLVRNSPQSELEGFAICGADQKWVWADAKIDGNSVLVWSDKVPAPVAVRYAWASNPTCNLVNSEGLPASPFRSDDFPATTLEKKL